MLQSKESSQKKLNQLVKAQAKERADYITRRNLDKEGDANWDKYVKKCLAWYNKYQEKEYRQFRVMYTRALYDLRKGIKSPHINI